MQHVHRHDVTPFRLDIRAMPTLRKAAVAGFRNNAWLYRKSARCHPEPVPRVRPPIRNPPLLIRSRSDRPLSSVNGDMLVPSHSVTASGEDG
jgi:hypothetical protein